MLPKNRRIQRKLFPLILSLGRRYHSQSVLLSVSKSENMAEPSRFSFSVSKKVCKSAVGRNKLRRAGYRVISSFLPNIHPGYLCFFSFKKGSTSILPDVLEKEIKVLFRDVGVL